MTDQDILNMVYDLIAQNPINGAYGLNGREHELLTEQVDHVDLDSKQIVFNNGMVLTLTLED